MSPWLTHVERLFLEKLNIFRFSSIKFFRAVVWPFWSWGKIALSLENISDTQKVFLDYPSKDFLTNFQKSYFFRKSFFLHAFGLFFASKKAFSKKYGFWRFVRKSFLRNPDILSGYLECSPDSGLSFPNFRMVIRLFSSKISYFECNAIFLSNFDQNPDFIIFGRIFWCRRIFWHVRNFVSKSEMWWKTNQFLESWWSDQN